VSEAACDGCRCINLEVLDPKVSLAEQSSFSASSGMGSSSLL
jgi:hypothetical protein